MGRYNAGDETDLRRIIASMNRRIQNLETSNRIGFTSIDRGALVDNTGASAAVVAGTGSSSGTATQTVSTLTPETYNSAPYGDLATIGPSFSVTVGQSRRAIVLLSANAHIVVNGSGDTNYGYMSFSMTGPTPLSPSDANAAGIKVTNANASAITIDDGISKIVPLLGILPGTYTVTAKYSGGTGAGGAVSFSTRSLAVVLY